MYCLVDLDNEWNNLLTSMPNWTIFQTAEWFNTNASVFFGKVERKGIVFYDEEGIAGVMPVVITRKFGFRLVGSPLRHLGLPYVGMAWRNDLEHCVREFGHFCKKQKIDMGMITFSGDEPALQAKRDRHTSRVFTETVVALERNEDQILAAMKPRSKTRIRQSGKAAFTIDENRDAGQLSEFLSLRGEMYDLQKMDWQRAHVYIAEIMSIFDPGQVKIFTIRYDDRTAACAVVLLFRDVAYYWDGATDPGFDSLSPGYPLQWHIIRWARSKGYKFYNLSGTNTPSIAFFKKGFGGEERRYVSLQWCNSLLLCGLWNGYRLFHGTRNPRLNGNWKRQTPVRPPKPGEYSRATVPDF